MSDTSIPAGEADNLIEAWAYRPVSGTLWSVHHDRRPCTNEWIEVHLVPASAYQAKMGELETALRIVTENHKSVVRTKQAGYAVKDARVAAAEAKVGELGDRIDELEGEAGRVSTEFEKECWVAMRGLLDECNYDWHGTDTDGVQAADAAEYIRITIDEIEKAEKRNLARAEAAEAKVAALKGEIHALVVELPGTLKWDLLKERNEATALVAALQLRVEELRAALAVIAADGRIPPWVQTIARAAINGGAVK